MASVEELDSRLKYMMESFMKALSDSNEQMLRRIEDSVTKSESRIQNAMNASIESLDFKI